MGLFTIDMLPLGGHTSMTFHDYRAFAVRSETPKVIVEKLEKAFKEILNDEEIMDTFQKMEWTVENLGSDGGANFLASEYQTKSEVAKAANIVPQ